MKEEKSVFVEPRSLGEGWRLCEECGKDFYGTPSFVYKSISGRLIVIPYQFRIISSFFSTEDLRDWCPYCQQQHKKENTQ